jgi:hypothetical protein
LEQIESQFNNQTRQKEVAELRHQKQTTVPIQRITHFAPWNETNQTFYNITLRKKGHLKTKSVESNHTATAIAEDIILGQPDDMTVLPNGQRIDRTGFPQC